MDEDFDAYCFDDEETYGVRQPKSEYQEWYEQDYARRAREWKSDNF